MIAETDRKTELLRIVPGKRTPNEQRELDRIMDAQRSKRTPGKQAALKILNDFAAEGRSR